MGTVTFVDKQTIIPATWLNDVNTVVWGVLGGATTAAQIRTAIGGTAVGVALFTTPDAATARGTLGLGVLATTSLVTTSLGGTGLSSAGTAGNILTSDGTNWTSASPAVVAVVPTGGIIPYAGSSAPSGWLMCDGSAVSRLGANSTLFGVIGTTYGAGDGSTTFNVPDMRSRVPVGVGTGITKETITSVTASSNSVAVASNLTKWVTGMQVVVSGASGFTGLVNGTFFIVRVDATHISIASSLANAQNGTVVAVTGTGSATFTSTWATRTLGEVGGEDTHAMSINELLSHNHPNGFTNGGTFGAGGGGASTNTGNTGGNQGMNIHAPFLGLNYIIRL